MAPAASDSAAPDPALAALVEAEQVRLIIDQVRRVPLPHAALDAFVAWIGWRAGLGMTAWLWLGAMTAAQVGRTVYLTRLHRRGVLSSSAMLSRQALLLALLGAIQAVMMALIFARPSAEARYVLTMVLVGNAAGAVATAAGHLRTYLVWAAVFGGALATCWIARMSFEGFAVAALVLMLFGMLAMYVRDQGRTLLDLVTLTEDLRSERDKLARMSDELRHERDRAERASEAKTRFFAAASHDLRQPLTALAYNAATVQALAESSGDETLTRVGAGIRRALTESRSLLDSLLEVSELDAGAVEVRRASVDVGALLAELGDSFAPLAGERGLALRVRVPPSRALLVHTDPALLRRIVQNLVGNAIKFTARGTVTLEARASFGAIQVSVADTGVGIPRTAQERVFDEFFQVGNVERDRSRGLGLGLAIVRRLAALIDTRVSVSSVAGQGSTFALVLPSDGDAAPPVPADPRTPAIHASSNRLHRILLIDDEPDIRESLATLLSTCGWEVAAEPGADEALGRLGEGFAPDALIVDFRLRAGASGLDALAALRGAGCVAPAWLVTGDTEPRRIAQARAAGVPVIYKPVDGLLLVTMLREAFGERAAA